jgi:hypothetical protein
MSEAALFYEAAFIGLGEKFLADVQYTIDRLRASRSRSRSCSESKTSVVTTFSVQSDLGRGTRRDPDCLGRPSSPAS